MTNQKRNNGTRIIGLILSLAFITSWYVPPIHSSPRETLIDPTTPAVIETIQPLAPDRTTKTRAVEALGKLPLMFEANAGQAAHEVKFLARGPGYNLFLTAGEAVMVLRGEHSASTPRASNAREEAKPVFAPQSTLRMKLVGANPRAHVEGQEALTPRINYFIGSDPRRWQTNVASYARV